MRNPLNKWCRWPGSNRHDRCQSRDFKGNACLNCYPFNGLVLSQKSFSFKHKVQSAKLAGVGYSLPQSVTGRHIHGHTLPLSLPP